MLETTSYKRHIVNWKTFVWNPWCLFTFISFVVYGNLIERHGPENENGKFLKALGLISAYVPSHLVESKPKCFHSKHNFEFKLLLGVAQILNIKLTLQKPLGCYSEKCHWLVSIFIDLFLKRRVILRRRNNIISMIVHSNSI